MTLTPHSSLDGYYNSSHDDWSFDIDPRGDGTIKKAEEAILAWTEWRDFLVERENTETLF